jgi:hypothetical protein
MAPGPNRLSDPSLTPKQREILGNLLLYGQPRPNFDAGLGPRLLATLEAVLRPVAEQIPPGKFLNVRKDNLTEVLQCEGLYEARRDKPFTWSIETVRGQLAHSAIQRHITSSQATPPLVLAERAIANAEADYESPVAQFIRSLAGEDREELLAQVADIVTKFVLDWPPIPRSWKPRVESRQSISVHGGAIRLRMKLDLALGYPTGQEARVLIVDFKTGSVRPHHVDDLRFYALVELLARGSPPFRVASYYLESGTYQAEDVTEETLETAVARVAAGVQKMWAVRPGGRPPELNPGPLCPYCPAFNGCDPGQEAAAR